jgi:hypothetical protein
MGRMGVKKVRAVEEWGYFRYSIVINGCGYDL